MDYINYYKKLENNNIIDKNKSFNMIKKRENRITFKKTSNHTLVISILCLKEIFNTKQIELGLLPAIITMIALPNITCYEEAKIIYDNKVKEYNFKQFKYILKLNDEYNKYNKELMFNLKCEIPFVKSTLNNHIKNTLNNIGYKCDCLKNKLQLEEEKLHLVVILRSILEDDPDNINAILSCRFQLNDIEISLNNMINNNNNNNNYDITYYLNSYLNINKSNDNLKKNLLKIEENISDISKKIMINKIPKNLGMYDKESLKYITPCNDFMNIYIYKIKNEIKG